VTEQGPAIAHRTPIFALLGANAVSQVGDTVFIRTTAYTRSRSPEAGAITDSP
jgi:hypothetical protein